MCTPRAMRHRHWIRLSELPSATPSGPLRRGRRVAGANMAGVHRTYVHNFSLNAMDLYGLQWRRRAILRTGRQEIRVFQEEGQRATGRRSSRPGC